MRFNKYLNDIVTKIDELAMSSKTIIRPALYKPESMYEAKIILKDGLKFYFICYYFRTEDTWEVAFEDKEERRYKIEQRPGASLELFAALETVFKDFINKALPNKFRFTADIEEKSRVKLYDLLSKKIEKMGFKFDRKISSHYIVYNFKHWSVQENLSELAMRKSTKIYVSSSSPSTYVAKIELENGTIFEFVAYRQQRTDHPPDWEIDFTDKEANIEITPKGRGEAIELFAAIEKVMEDFIKRYNPQRLHFSSIYPEPSKKKLYDTLAKKLAKKGKYELYFDDEDWGWGGKSGTGTWNFRKK